MSPKVRFSFSESVLGKCALVWGGEGVLRNFLPFDSPSETKNEVLNESADLIFHLMILLKKLDLNFTDVINILYERNKKIKD